MAYQDQLCLAFYADGLKYRFTKIVSHDELVAEAIDHWTRIPPEQRDFDQAKAEFMSRSI